MQKPGFRVLFSPAAQRDLEKLSQAAALQLVLDAREHLQDSPHPLGNTRIKRMSGFAPPLYRLRSGDFRAYYRIDGRDVVILAVTNRKDSARLLKKLR